MNPLKKTNQLSAGNSSQAVELRSKDNTLLSILQNNSSKVVDENGEPLVVYHGTPSDFTVFNVDYAGNNSGDKGMFGLGFYFSPSKGYTEIFSGKDGHTVSTFLNIRKPFDPNLATAEDVIRLLGIEDETSVGTIKLMELRSAIKSFSYKREKLLRDNLIWEGFDGVLSPDKYEATQCVAFSPSQIKSANTNNGNFDNENDDIRYMFTGEKGAANLDAAEKEREGLSRMQNPDAARKMEIAKKDAENIKLATGWERGADGKWRYEI